jgi:ribose transport system permease protein
MGLAIIIALAASTAIGLLNGFMVSTIGIPALIATFATQTAFSGIALIICDGQPINGFTEAFKVFGQGKIGPVPVPVIIMILCFALGAFILNKTYFGRYFYAVGGNIEAARLSGIRTGRVKYLVFALSGFFAGLAGLVLLSRVNSGMGNAGLGYEFKVITCVVLGGVSVAGGSGRMSGVIAGTFIISALNNGMVLINLNSWIQNIVLGIVLVLAVGFDCYQKKRQAN